jgi:glutaredoxin-related protein
MANLTPSDSWDDVYEITGTDPVRFDIPNSSNQNLLNRTERIKETLSLAGIDVENKSIDGIILLIDTLNDLEAYTGDAKVIYLKGRVSDGDGGEGVFIWNSSDLSTEVVADTLYGIYVPPASDATGTSGSWVRQNINPILPGMFGATGSGDDTAPINAMFDMAGLLEGARFCIDNMYTVTRIYITHDDTYVYGKDKSCGFSQTEVGIVDNMTTGQTPQFAMLHINPDDYLHNSGSSGYIENITLCGLNFTGPHSTITPYNVYRCGIQAQCIRNYKVIDCELKYFAAETLHCGSSSNYSPTNVTYENNYIHDTGGSTAINTAKNAKIIRNRVENIWHQNGIGCNGIGITIDNNYIGAVGSVAAISVGGSGYESTIGYGTVISRNIIVDPEKNGISLNDDGATTIVKSNFLVNGNILYGNEVGSTSGIVASFTQDGSNVVISNNIITGFNNRGFTAASGGCTYYLKGNTITGTSAQTVGVYTEAAYTGVVYLDSNSIQDHTIDIQTTTKIRSSINTVSGSPTFSGAYAEKINTLTYSATPAVEASYGGYYRLTVTDGTAFTIQNPTNPIIGQTITFEIQNAHSGAITPAFDTQYIEATPDAIGAGQRQIYTFCYRSANNWVEQSRSSIY